MSKVGIHIVTWNSLDVLPVCLAGVFNQDLTDFEVIVIDNASNDKTLDFLQRQYPQVKIISNNSNLGFSKAHNIAINQSQAEFILPLNPDVFLDPTFLTACSNTITDDQMIGAVAPRMYGVNRERFLLRDFSNLSNIDSTGITMLKSRRLILRKDHDQGISGFSYPAEVFGADGAAPFYRRSMLEDIKIDDEYFDEDFFAYKEDHDLAWRARLMGWKTIYAPDAIAHHIRRTKPGLRQEMEAEFRILGIRNRYLMMRKNELKPLFVRDLMNILYYDLGILIYILLFERPSWKSYSEAWRLLPRMTKKRQHIMANKRVNWRNMVDWFV